MITFNEVVTKREKFNLSLPVPLMRAFEAAAERFGSKRKWMAFAAAVLRFLEMQDDERRDYVKRIGGADLSDDGYDLLLKEAEAKPPPGFDKLVGEPVTKRPEWPEESPRSKPRAKPRRRSPNGQSR